MFDYIGVIPQCEYESIKIGDTIKCPNCKKLIVMINNSKSKSTDIDAR
jgi:DNA-directed RNA polymerase subunit RPC12/RpoP